VRFHHADLALIVITDRDAALFLDRLTDELDGIGQHFSIPLSTNKYGTGPRHGNVARING
jgi:hypothetical protein